VIRFLTRRCSLLRSTPSLHFNISFSCETSSTVTSRLSPPLCLRSFCTRPTPGRCLGPRASDWGGLRGDRRLQGSLADRQHHRELRFLFRRPRQRRAMT
jgi:hypothetical protein